MAGSAVSTEDGYDTPPSGVVRPLRPYVMADDDPVPAPRPVGRPAARPAPQPFARPAPPPPPPPAPPTGYSAGTPAPEAPPQEYTRSSLAVRPFLLTAGRVAGAGFAAGGGAAGPLPLETQVVSTTLGLHTLAGLTFEHHAIVDACRVPQSLAELAARLRLHLNVVRVIADDLRGAGQLAVYAPQASTAQDASVLRRVIDGLRAVPDSRGLPRDNRPA
jgi:hypothetical protein